jgi:LmbE family N-acetylglucosaminyl deacetylase
MQHSSLRSTYLNRDGGAIPASVRRTRGHPLFVVSPHLDDAVFSCGMLLAACPGAVVCTVFAGTPPKPQNQPWDEAAGFRDSTRAMQARTREDERALLLCGAQAIRLGFLDGQYAPLDCATTLAQALEAQLEPYPGATIVVPLGLRHPDHQRVAQAWIELFRARRITSCIVYEEAIHRTARGLTGQCLARLADARFRTTPLDAAWCPERMSARAQSVKRRCVLAYSSQLRAFGDRFPVDLAGPERYWHVEWAGTPSAPHKRSAA